MRIALVGIGLAVALFAVPASADTGLGSFAGTWSGMREDVVIDSGGTGHFDYSDFHSCPSCAMANVPRSTVNFTLTTVSGSVASGTISASSDTGAYSVGEPVTATLQTQSWGQTIQWSVNNQQIGLFCTSAQAQQCGG
ncbi:hypothetical protein ACIP5Y_23815 [Nocardia sp. NPDC088792]|uniref:hypothetical protein n=1 Tax=Nocardia sp. NPDC088792 TaxID=3364332 RepID=UPI003804BB68